MSVRHLAENWAARVLPRRLARLTGSVARRSGLADRLIALNVGDILAVVGRRP
jgi:hypothetical protein